MSDKIEAPKPTLQPQENITQAQVTHLLNIFIPACNFLLADKMHDDDTPPGGKNDGGARMAVEATIINVCNRFDAMLADEQRWTLANHTDLESHFKQVYEQHARMLEKQADAYAEITSPHHKLKPKLMKVPEGSWIAYVGDLNHIEEAIVGIGTCPADAIEAFDALFKGQVPENLQAWLAARGVDLNKEQQTNTNEQQKNAESMGNSRTGQTENPPSRRSKRSRNRRDAGSNPEVGGDKNPK